MKIGRIVQYQRGWGASSGAERHRLPGSNRAIDLQSGVVRNLECACPRDIAGNLQGITVGSSVDRSVIYDGGCNDSARAFQSAFNINGCVLQGVVMIEMIRACDREGLGHAD